jgi:hypothetical protein
MGIIVEPYALAQFMPAVGITDRVGKHAILCAKERKKAIVDVPHREESGPRQR